MWGVGGDWTGKGMEKRNLVGFKLGLAVDFEYEGFENSE